MVPNNALSLSSDGIALLRRDGDVWRLLREMSFDTDDLDAALAALRDAAVATGADGQQVLLILPDDQIRYLDLPDPGDDAARDAGARAVLDGATPYQVSELVYDWLPVLGQLQVAAVAMETLAEAEAFIAAHGFEPVSFAAAPAKGNFAGAPFFGAASGWAGPAPHRIAGPIRVVAAAQVSEPKAAIGAAPDTKPAPMAEPETPPLPKATGVKLPLVAPDEPPDASPAEPPEPAPKAMHGPDPLPDPGPPPAFLAMPPAAPSAPNKDAAPVSFGTGVFGPGGEARAAALAPLPEPSAPRTRPVAPLPEERPGFSSIRASRELPDSNRQMVLTSDAPKPAASPVAAPAITEAPPSVGRPSLRAAPAPAPGNAPAVSAAAVGPALGAPVPEAPAPEAPARKLRQPAKPAPTPAARKAPAAKPAQSAAPQTAEAPKPAPSLTEPAPPKPARTRRRKAAKPVPARIEPTEPSPALQAAMAGSLDPEEERRRMTVFGARREDQVGGKPRFFGLMLTMVLLVFLLAVAAWASVFLDEGLSQFFGPDDDGASVVASVSPEPDTPEPDVVPEVLALLPPAPGADPVPAVLPETAPETTPPTPGPVRIAPSPEEAAARYAATGIWQRSPSSPPDASPDSIDDVYVASVDPKVGQFDAVALPPEPRAEGGALALPVPLPPGPDVRYDLDQRGLVRATPEGAISPDGVRVFTGPPPRVPPARAPAAIVEDTADVAPNAPATAPADPVDPALGVRRPSARPGDLVEQSERVVLSGFSVAELEDKRPVIRPDSVRTTVAEAVAQAVAADTPTPEEIAETEPPETEPEVGTPLAVARSLEPQLRPNGMATRAEEATVQTASAAAVRTPAPRIPQNANVAQQATVSNQLNLREINLIGVFGTSSNRRALVRLSNGRLQNVKVGDRLDGGRVAAIGEAELQLTKSGRNVVLRMPRS